jgi:hypothetical protein
MRLPVAALLMTREVPSPASIVGCQGKRGCWCASGAKDAQAVEGLSVAQAAGLTSGAYLPGHPGH